MYLPVWGLSNHFLLCTFGVHELLFIILSIWLTVASVANVVVGGQDMYEVFVCISNGCWLAIVWLNHQHSNCDSWGVVIAIIHQYADTWQGWMLHEHVNDKSIKAAGGLQHILTNDGYVILISITLSVYRMRNGTPCCMSFWQVTKIETLVFLTLIWMIMRHGLMPYLTSIWTCLVKNKRLKLN